MESRSWPTLTDLSPRSTTAKVAAEVDADADSPPVPDPGSMVGTGGGTYMAPAFAGVAAEVAAWNAIDEKRCAEPAATEQFGMAARGMRAAGLRARRVAGRVDLIDSLRAVRCPDTVAAIASCRPCCSDDYGAANFFFAETKPFVTVGPAMDGEMAGRESPTVSQDTGSVAGASPPGLRASGATPRRECVLTARGGAAVITECAPRSQN